MDIKWWTYTINFCEIEKGSGVGALEFLWLQIKKGVIWDQFQIIFRMGNIMYIRNGNWYNI